MKYVDEYRGADEARKLVTAIERLVTRPWNLMEICGGQTHTMIKAGIDRMLPDKVTMIHMRDPSGRSNVCSNSTFETSSPVALTDSASRDQRSSPRMRVPDPISSSSGKPVISDRAGLALTTLSGRRSSPNSITAIPIDESSKANLNSSSSTSREMPRSCSSPLYWGISLTALRGARMVPTHDTGVRDGASTRPLGLPEYVLVRLGPQENRNADQGRG